VAARALLRPAESMPTAKPNSHQQNAKPLELGAKLLCRWRGADLKTCEVLDRRQNEAGEWLYCACLAASPGVGRPWSDAAGVRTEDWYSAALMRAAPQMCTTMGSTAALTSGSRSTDSTWAV